MGAAKRDFIDLSLLDAGRLRALLDLAAAVKRGEVRDRPLAGRCLAMIFRKSSTRTRVSTEAGMVQLGGHAIMISDRDSQIGRGESVSDTAQVLSRYVDAILIRTFAHDDVVELARGASVPVINGLTDLLHPCQVAADLLTAAEEFGCGVAQAGTRAARGGVAAAASGPPFASGGRGSGSLALDGLDKLRVAWIGDGNNMANSWINAAERLGFTLTLACPPDYQPDPDILARAQSSPNAPPGRIALAESPAEAAECAHVVTTDVWASMGQEDEQAERAAAFRGYEVDAPLMARADPAAIFLHCLPAHRGEEVAAEVIDGPQSRVWREAENRLHLIKALLLDLLGGTP